MSEACLTINFKTKNISIDGKAITFDHLNNGDFDTVFDSDQHEWRIKKRFKLFGHVGDEIAVISKPAGLQFFIMIWAEEGHLLDSKIVKKLKNKYGLNLKTQHNSRVDILDTAWKHAYLEYDIRYSGITLVLKE